MQICRNDVSKPFLSRNNNSRIKHFKWRKQCYRAQHHQVLAHVEPTFTLTIPIQILSREGCSLLQKWEPGGWITLFLCKANGTAAFPGMASRVQGIPPAEKSTRKVARKLSCTIFMAVSLVSLSQPGEISLQGSQPQQSCVPTFLAPGEILLF